MNSTEPCGNTSIYCNCLRHRRALIGFPEIFNKYVASEHVCPKMNPEFEQWLTENESELRKSESGSYEFVRFKHLGKTCMFIRDLAYEPNKQWQFVYCN